MDHFELVEKLRERANVSYEDAKRALEILDRYGVGDAVCSKGVSWNVGRTFFRDSEVYNFNLLPQPDHKRPGMINLQQYYLEEFEITRAKELPNLDLRFKNKVLSVTPQGDGATLQVETPDGIYSLETDWLVVADGARSNIRRMMNLEMDGKVFMDRFLIADVVMKADFPVERWFWFDPPFHKGQSVLLHREADNVYRIDFQLGWQADPEEEKKPENVIPRIKAMLGEQLTLPEPVWTKVNLSWIAFFVVMGFLNLIIAFNFPTDIWVNYKLFGGMGLMLVFVLGQGFLLSKYVE